MTRPELPPGYHIRPAASTPGVIWLTQESQGARETYIMCSTDFSGDRHGLVGTAWAIWNEAHPEWAVYLAHLESETP
jgi:hypothetical protein